MRCKDCYKEGCPQRVYTDDAECVFQQWTAKQFDWQSFRNQAAKDILCAMIAKFGIKDKLEDIIIEDIKFSIVCADVLIAKLKETEEK